jgi:hypothetical protein
MAEDEGERGGGQRWDGTRRGTALASYFDEGIQTPAVTLLFKLIAGNKLVVRAPSGSVRELGA